MKKAVLPKAWAWIILTALIILDASLDLIFAGGKGLESFIWKPISNLLNVSNPLFLTPIVLIIFYLLVKGGAWLTRRIDKTPCAEELVLTTLVIIYCIFDLWLIAVYLFDFSLFRNHLYLIPLLIIIGIIYGSWAERKLKKENQKI